MTDKLLTSDMLDFLGGFENKNTRLAYTNSLRKLVSALGEIDPLEATSKDLLGAANVHGLCSASTWNSMVACWRGFYRHLYEIDEIPKDPAKVLKSRKRSDKIQPTPTEKEMDAIWAYALDEARTKGKSPSEIHSVTNQLAALALLNGCGLRVSEVRNADVGDVTLAGTDDCSEGYGSILVRGKGDRTDVLPLPRGAIEFLEPVTRDRLPTEPLLADYTSGKRISEPTLNNLIRDLAIGAGCDIVYTPHAYRRYAITAAITDTGGDYRHVKAWARHKDIRTTLGYDSKRQEIPALGSVKRKRRD